jgi:hypothetical protein
LGSQVESRIKIKAPFGEGWERYRRDSGWNLYFKKLRVRR